MATYVNDLRLKEIATGDESGTWGTSTNTNLELIGEALGYGTQEVFSSDADATTTIADGASDPARAMYFKITSGVSLTATRTCTIAPNTVSRVMFIENATTGSQSITISQGSGANVTIATGRTAVVYLDGAGSGAAVVDALALVDPGVTDTLAEVLVAGNTSGGTNIELTTTDKVQFRDTAIYINSSADGQLDIVADTEVQIATTTVDLNGILDVSGNTTLGADVTFTGASYNAVWDSSDSALEFADNAKAVFGAGSDLQIYHTGSGSFISDQGTGPLNILTSGFNVINPGNTETLIDAVENGAVQLYYDNAAKIATTATGVDVTGTVTADGLTVDGEGTFTKNQTADTAVEVSNLGTAGATTTASFIVSEAAGTPKGWFRRYRDGTAITAVGFSDKLVFEGAIGSTPTNRMEIDASGNVGIGTSSPPEVFAIGATSSVAGFSIGSGDTQVFLRYNNYFSGTAQVSDATKGAASISLGRSSDGVIPFNTAAAGAGTPTEAMRIDASSNVGIGTDSPSSVLSVKSDINNNVNNGILFEAADSTNKLLQLYENSVGECYMGFYQADVQTALIRTNGASYFNGGNVGIGISIPSEKLNLAQSVPSTYTAGLSTLAAPAGTNLRIENNSSVTDTFTGVLFVPTNGAGQPQISYMGSVSTGSGLGADIVFGRRESSTYYVESMRIDSSGRLMVNQTSLSAASAGVKMQVASDILTTGSLAGYFWENRSGMTISEASGWGGWYSTGTTSHFLYSDGANKASINRTSGAYTALSDVNKKKDFEDSSVGLAAIMQLQPKKFRMLDDADDAPKYLGFVAQDVENVIPEAYVEDTSVDAGGVENTFIGLTDRPFIAALVKAIQEQQAIIDSLTARIEALES